MRTIREDDVLQTSIGGYAQSAMRWSPRVRTIAGLRLDRYAFDVDATRTASLASPKLSLVLGPWRASELYLNAGSGFHSNDARGGREVTPLARTKGAEIGMRTAAPPGLEISSSLWTLVIASELVFVGDACTTEAGRPSRRRGVEVSATYDARNWLSFDAQYAYSRGRFADGTASPAPLKAWPRPAAPSRGIGHPLKSATATSARGRSSKTTACARMRRTS